MRIGVFGFFPPVAFSDVSLVSLVPGDSLVGPFQGFVFCSYSVPPSTVLSDSWLTLALSLSAFGFPILWSVAEHPRWLVKAEALLSTSGVLVVDSTLPEVPLLEHIVLFVHSLSYTPASSAVYALRFDSMVSLVEAEVLDYLVSLSDPELFLKDLIIEKLESILTKEV
ncbi:hypothetical protein [Paenibacillus macquariensis]|uniref:Uncharacterized protein n=1 Tax=Paenibacillus macquariensis TaxID=948756 RepID=A0ABY1KHB7_9BACL|nr:hypothetical protein [Paenibacillus macquariensis]OAB28463.1 hypothetical protein PMSM_24370 [Paenibacillus macquariensis subsp. macquariensis]SIR71848.1 hypothetical protein SAMN05421578_1442 [Paenibacillus macquariensis]